MQRYLQQLRNTVQQFSQSWTVATVSACVRRESVVIVRRAGFSDCGASVLLLLRGRPSSPCHATARYAKGSRLPATNRRPID